MFNKLVEVQSEQITKTEMMETVDVLAVAALIGAQTIEPFNWPNFLIVVSSVWLLSRFLPAFLKLWSKQ